MRGRALRGVVPDGAVPTFGLYLLASAPPAVAWESRWLRWPDFRLPADRSAAVDVLQEVWRRLDSDRVEVACAGGRGRTGTALACLVALDSGPGVDPVAYVREHYDPHAIETGWQRRYAAKFPSR